MGSSENETHIGFQERRSPFVVPCRPVKLKNTPNHLYGVNAYYMKSHSYSLKKVSELFASIAHTPVQVQVELIDP